MKYLGIDLGSSYVKAFLIDTDTRSIIGQSAVRMPGKTKSTVPGAYEIDAALIEKLVKDMVEAYAADTMEELEGILFSVQMHGFVYTTPGRADTYVSWQDMRCLNPAGDGRSYLEHLKELLPPDVMAPNGVYLKPSMGLCNLYTMLEEEPSIPRNGTLYTLGSYLIYRLTGRNITHAESLAPLGFLDVQNRCINWDVVRRIHFEEITFPELAKEDYEICGTYRMGEHEWKVFPDYGDMQVAVLGSNVREGDVIINTATAGQTALVSSKYVPGEYEIRPYFENCFLYTISNMPAGRNLAVLIGFMKEVVSEMAGIEIPEAKIWEKVHSFAGQREEGLLADVNFYKNPYFTEGGSIRHITQDNLHIGSLFSAAYQNMAETYWKYIKELVRSEDEINGIVCAGGVNWKTPELVQKIQKVSGKKCRLSAMKDEAAAGLLSLAVACSGKKMG